MIVVKIGGGGGIDIDKIASDVASFKENKLILVHGGNYELDKLTRDLGLVKKNLTSPNGLKSRYTTRETIDLMYMTYAGSVNKKIVESLQRNKVNAIGLSGIDGKLIIGKRHDSLLTVENGRKKVVRDDLTGNVESVNIDLLNLFLNKGLIPVIAPPVMTNEGEVINVDGDKIASKIALEMQAPTLIFLIEAGGVMEDINDPDSKIDVVEKENLDEILETVEGRMKRKIIECRKLLEKGIGKIIIADGRVDHPISNALNGGGTNIS